jgi:hypothetical protein
MVPLLVAAHIALARGEIRVDGSASNVHVDVRDAAAAEVLAAIAERFALRVHGTVVDRRISGNFDGPLRQVIARVLDGYDYVIRTRDGALEEVIVLNAASPHAAAPPIYAPATFPATKLRRDE